MSTYAEYATKYKNIRLERRHRILQATFHTDGGPLKWGGVHRDFSDAFHEISADQENKVLIMTGTGDAFCTELAVRDPSAFVTPSKRWATIIWEANQMLANFIAMEIPVISAINGPVSIHPELPVLADIVLAAETASFKDAGHFPRGIVPGDGNHVVWPHLLGMNRGRYFLLTGQEISAQEALSLGVVSEVLPNEQLLPRAWELAGQLAEKPDLALRYTKTALTLQVKRLLQSDMGYGLASEALAAVDNA